MFIDLSISSENIFSDAVEEDDDEDEDEDEDDDEDEDEDEDDGGNFLIGDIEETFLSLLYVGTKYDKNGSLSSS